MKIVILKALYLIRVSSIRIFWLLFKILPFKKLVEIKNAPRDWLTNVVKGKQVS